MVVDGLKKKVFGVDVAETKLPKTERETRLGA